MSSAIQTSYTKLMPERPGPTGLRRYRNVVHNKKRRFPNRTVSEKRRHAVMESQIDGSMPPSKNADADDAKRKQEHGSRLGGADGAIDPEIGEALIIWTVCHPDCQRVEAGGQFEHTVTDTLRTIAVFRVGAAACPVIRLIHRRCSQDLSVKIVDNEGITLQDRICDFQHCWRSQI